MDLFQLRMILQQLEQCLRANSAQRHIAMFLPSVLVQRDIGEHIYGRFEHKDLTALPVPMETVPGIAALQISPVAFPHGVDPLLVSVSGLSFRIVSHKNGIVELSGLILRQLQTLVDQILFCKSRYHFIVKQAGP